MEVAVFCHHEEAEFVSPYNGEEIRCIKCNHMPLSRDVVRSSMSSIPSSEYCPPSPNPQWSCVTPFWFPPSPGWEHHATCLCPRPANLAAVAIPTPDHLFLSRLHYSQAVYFHGDSENEIDLYPVVMVSSRPSAPRQKPVNSSTIEIAPETC